MLISIEKCKELTDSEMVAKSLENIDYFTCMYLRYEEQLKRYILRISKVSIEEAEDILQEGYIKIWKNLNAFDPSMKLSSWLYRIIHNQTISYWRSVKSDKSNPTFILDERASHIIYEEFESDEDMEHNEKKLQKAINDLPSKYKDVLILKFFEKMSYEDISDVLKIPEGTVATRLNRAKRAIRKQIS